MNNFFGGQLREELVKLIYRPELLHNRTHSTGSERLSLDSVDSNQPANKVKVTPYLQKLGYLKD